MGLASLNLPQRLLEPSRAQLYVNSYSSFLLNGAMVAVLRAPMPKVSSFLQHMDRAK